MSRRKGHTCADYGDRSCKACYPPLALWGSKHCQEALAQTYDFAAEMARRGPSWARPVARFLEGAEQVSESEAAWRAHLLLFGFDAARVNAAVQHVRDLAEGRKVRVTEWQVRVALGGLRIKTTMSRHITSAEAHAECKARRGVSASVVKVTSTRPAR